MFTFSAQMLLCCCLRVFACLRMRREEYVGRSAHTDPVAGGSFCPSLRSGKGLEQNNERPPTAQLSVFILSQKVKR